MISVVIPSYNRRDNVLQLLRDVFSQEGAEFEVIVVDDCSPDDSVEAICREFPQVKLLVNEVNGGPCVTRNKGLQAAIGEIVVGFDSDVTLDDPQLLAKVIMAFEANPVTGFAFRIFTPDGTTDDAPRWWHPAPLQAAGQRSFETDYFSGTAYAFKREPVISAGLYPEFLYMHYEEVILAYRILDAGGVIQYRPDLCVVHHANPVSRRNEISVFYKPRNQILLALACFPIVAAIRYLAPRLSYQLIKALRGGHLDGFFRAMHSAAVLAPALLRMRKPLKKETMRRIRDLRKNGTSMKVGFGEPQELVT